MKRVGAQIILLWLAIIIIAIWNYRLATINQQQDEKIVALEEQADYAFKNDSLLLDYHTILTNNLNELNAKVLEESSNMVNTIYLLQQAVNSNMQFIDEQGEDIFRLHRWWHYGIDTTYFENTKTIY